jgi:hypothetical protein
LQKDNAAESDESQNDVRCRRGFLDRIFYEFHLKNRSYSILSRHLKVEISFSTTRVFSAAGIGDKV